MEILSYNDNKIEKCDNCGTTLCVEKNDYKIGEHGFLYYLCPVCSTNNYTNEHIQLDETNIQYPHREALSQRAGRIHFNI